MGPKQKTPCKAGQPQAWVLALRKHGTTLVDCPHCARQNLSSTSAAYLGFCDWAGCYEGREYGLIPPHTEVPLDVTTIPTAQFGNADLDNGGPYPRQTNWDRFSDDMY